MEKMIISMTKRKQKRTFIFDMKIYVSFLLHDANSIEQYVFINFQNLYKIVSLGMVLKQLNLKFHSMEFIPKE